MSTMINHKKVINKFYNLEEKYFKDPIYEISKNYLHFLILNPKFNSKGFKISEFLINLLLLILSLYTIFLCKIKKITIANYFIVHKNKKGFYDFRSKYILREHQFEKSLNIVRCNSFLDALKAYFRYPNVIFFLSIDYFSSRYSYQDRNLKKNYEIIHKKEIKNYNTLIKIFKFLKIRKFLSIDDQRVIQLFLKVCQNLKIESFGYMHYKFSDFVVGIKYLPFDCIVVWSTYFKKKLLKVNSKYKNKKILISGYLKKNIPKNNKFKDSKNINVMYIYDDHLDYNFTKSLLKKLNINKKVKLFVKLKPQNSEKKWEELCLMNKINYFKYETFDEINNFIKFDYFIGNISTALLEAPMYGAIPLKIVTKNDFADDLIKDKVVVKVRNYNDIINIITKKPSLYKINKLFNMVWGTKKYSSYFVKNFFRKFIYD